MDRAVSSVEQAIRLNPRQDASYSARGAAYGRKGDLERAAADFDQAVRVSPELAPLYFRHADFSSRQRKLDLAQADLKTAQALQPNRMSATVGLDRLQALMETGASRIAPGEPARAIPAELSERFALVIGNGLYSVQPALFNAHRGAEAIAQTLGSVGFKTVRIGRDLRRDDMLRALQRFEASCRSCLTCPTEM